MQEHWFFAPPECWGDETVTLPRAESHHALDVLRVRPGTEVTVVDGAGVLARGVARTSREDRLVVDLVTVEHPRSPVPAIAVYQGVAKGSKLDGAVQMLGELGVAELHSFSSRRSVVRWDETKTERLTQRWTSIAMSAAKQSRNPFVMQVSAGLSLADLVERLSVEPLAVVLWEQATLPLRGALIEGVERIALVIGPEGGLASEETEAMADAGALPVTLGPRILRTEHAAALTASAVLYHYGLIG